MKNIPYLIAKISILLLLIIVPLCLDARKMDNSSLSFTEHNKDSLYKEIPKCPLPNSSYYSSVDKSTVLVFWDDLPAVKGELEYEVRYKSMSRGGWREKYIYEGKSILIDDLTPGLTYSFEIRKICYSETGTFKVEGEWVGIRPVAVRSSSIGINCDTLGEIEILPGDGFTTSFSVPSGIWSLVSDEDCYLIFQLVYCRIVFGSLRCVTIYWFYDGTQMNNFSLDIDQLDPRMNLDSTTTPYLESAYVSMYCEADSGLPLGAVYGSEGWDSLDLDLDCLDTLLFSAPENTNEHCGEPFVIPDLAPGSLSTAQVGDTFTIAGYPMILTSVTGGSGTFSGEADLVLPWQGSVVNIPFTSVSVNLKKQITSGSLELESDPLFDPDEVEILDIGGQICVPPSSPAFWDSLGNHSVTGLPWDPNGFGEDSLYVKDPPYPGYEEGDPYDPNYDPNGFNFDGNHAVTGTPYNELGCSQAGIDTSGMPCNPAGSGPYYWLNNNPTGPPTQEGIELANEVKDTLEDLIIELLGIMELSIQDTLDLQRDSCNAIRSDMDDLLEVLNYNRDFIYGPADEYYAERMSENFTSRPQPFEVDMDRNPDTEDLENKHIDLYDCDTKVIVYLNILDLIDQLGGSPDLDDFASLILEKIKRFSSSQVAQYETMSELIEWLEQEILIQLDLNYRQEYGSIIGMNDVKKSELWIDDPYASMNSYASSIDNFWSTYSDFHPGNLDESNSYSIINKFRNGDLWIDGVHRAQILEMIVDNKAAMASLGGSSIMPLEISKELFGIEYTILIDRILLTPTGGEVDVFMIIQDPRSGQGIVFQSLGLEFSPNGIVGNSNLSLASEVQIRLSNAARLIIHGTPETYVSWDCSGFTGMGVDASIEFCRSFLTPLDSVTLEPLPESDSTRVMADFTVDIPVWGEFLAEISVDPFAVTGYEDFRWVVEEAKLDFSELQSPEIQFPENYTSPFVSNGIASEEWKGFYFKELSATFPAQFSNDTSQITLGVHDVIFDDRGFTGTVFVNSNIVTLENGNLAGWPFSIDSLEVAFVANNLMGGSIKGLVNVPIFESATDPNPEITGKDCFAYSAEMRKGGGFEFIVSTNNSSLKADLFKASEVVLRENSSISVLIHGDTVRAVARLTGSIAIESPAGSAIGMDFDQISFSDFEIANYSPYFSPGLWSLPSGFGINVAGFGASVNSIQLVRTSADDEAALSSNLNLALAGDSLGIVANARTRIIGKLITNNERQKWVFDRIAIDEISIDATVKGNRVYGGLIFFEDDPVFGKGFKGILGLDIESLGASVEAAGQFGKIENGYKYFFVDALVNLGVGISVGPLQINGFGGGLYYHMSRDTSDILPIPSSETGTPSFGALGVGISGIQYLPDSLTGIGFKANLVFSTTASKKAFNGNVGFEIAFQSSGGISEIILEGNARFMSDMDFAKAPTFATNSTTPPISSSSVALSAYVKIRFDFVNSILDADLDVFLNAPAFRGKGINGKMVWAKAYFSKYQWYINIGKPSNPCGIVFEIPGIGEIGEVTAYINIGDGIEPMPPLPDIVRSIAGEFRPNPMRGRGKGFAFGAAFKISTGERKFLLLRASLEAGAGFDVLLQDYGDATCLYSGEKPGIDGWYATGQVYAYLEGKVGVKVAGNLIPVLELGVAAALQGRMPNPIWLEGAFGVRYNVCNGLVKGSCKFRFQLGQECEMIPTEGDTSVLDYVIIDYITPLEMSLDVPTDGAIEVYCNYPLETIFNSGIEDNEFIIKVSSVKMLWHANELPVKYIMEEGGFLLIANCTYYLPERDTVYFIVKLDIMEDGVLSGSESDTIWFVTGDSPDFIPPSNVSFTYPMIGQYNFHPKELSNQKGYIFLKLGQPYLFTGEDKPDLILVQSPSGETVELDYMYDYLNSKVEFKLPSSILEPGGLYKIALVGLDDPNQDKQEFSSTGINLPGLQPGTPIPHYVPLQGTENLTLSDKKVLFQWVFRVSIYDTFKNKISTTGTINGTYSPPVDLSLGVFPQGTELLSNYDLKNFGFGGVKSFITLNPNELWYKTSKIKNMYDYWSWVGTGDSDAAKFGHFTGLVKPRRDFAYPPTDAFKMLSNNSHSALVTEASFLSGQVFTSNIQQFHCESYKIMQEDWRFIKNQLTGYILNNPGAMPNPIHSGTPAETINFILNNDFPLLEGELSALHQVTWIYDISKLGVLSNFPTTVFGL